MRKLLMGAVVASVSLAVAAGAIAQAPESTFTAKATPSDAGTAKKPKNTKLTFNVTLDKPNTTVEFIDLALPKGLKLSGKGMKRCTVDTLAFEGPEACPSGSKAGPTGSATADYGPEGPQQSKLVFEVSPFVLDANTFVFYVASESGSGIAVQSPITGEITAKGRKIRIKIPVELRQPGGVDASLTSLNQTFSGKVKKNYVVSSVGCKKRQHKFTGKLEFSKRLDGAAVPADVGIRASAGCKK